MNTIADEWARFERDVVPSGAPALQRSEMKIAFYGGASAMLLMQLRLARQDLSDEANIAILEGLHQECQRFKDNFLRTGRA